MNPSEDFLVVENELPFEHKFQEVKEIIQLFSCSVDALNQSTILLKDELNNALSYVLDHLKPDNSICTEDILKNFNHSLTSTDDVRREYTRRLCTKLVSIEAEKCKLQNECSQLRAGTWLYDYTDENVDAVNKRLGEIHVIIEQLEKNTRTKTAVPQSDQAPLLVRLDDIKDRLARIQLICSEKIDGEQEKHEAAKFSSGKTKTPTQPSIEEPVTQTDSGDNHSSDTSIAQSTPDSHQEPSIKSKSITDQEKFQRKVQQLMLLTDPTENIEKDSTPASPNRKKTSGVADMSEEPKPTDETQGRPACPAFQGYPPYLPHGHMYGPPPFGFDPTYYGYSQYRGPFIPPHAPRLGYPPSYGDQWIPRPPGWMGNPARPRRGSSQNRSFSPHNRPPNPHYNSGP